MACNRGEAAGGELSEWILAGILHVIVLGMACSLIEPEVRRPYPVMPSHGFWSSHSCKLVLL